MFDNGLKETFKNITFTTYNHLISPWNKKLQLMLKRQKVIVLGYHRVCDDFKDDVTVGIEQFERQMDILVKGYAVISIEDLVSQRFPNTERNIIAVTFDDGYLDNYLNALPILLKYGVPAAFFVSTGIIGTNRGFKHDLERLKRPVPVMNWQHLQDMITLGFTIGAHTVNHINCGKTELDVVTEELLCSRKTLEEKLGIKNFLFAYPFGKTSDITLEVIEVVKKAGYSACFSGYGGSNTLNQIDLFNIKRIGINHNWSDSAFRARLNGLMTGTT